MNYDSPYVILGTETVADLQIAMSRHPAGLFLDMTTLKAILRAYMNGQLSDDSLLQLAEFLEMNEGVSVPSIESRAINDILFSVANPEINFPNTIEKMQSLLGMSPYSDSL
ncbi:hypothetical protein EC912_101438 [Luteibacter rhizovicinus]|uniref:Uncharacterized protein n=1 Tax=Luteibacter rhizovicinus TaxID=242606 RepID=A0A4R3YXX1_9GAMM|nr:hypothetical protein [Luteibacter rhizovicinus]TCV97426.1 hypothetical protein EC912_101438 [Luteibacter rhizovicinus]